ncbi:ABC transporter permease [Saccharibacillus alkalitolerans]|uniref:ABC transporter permease n=1 Tax=Saccharibacillus alkalitolerans TaxID=2705290 RepID=A0ABX0FEB3_9BACL|nr:ABC transporter permease [Saccharibacillus alkalitolerans]NGZ77502.1 ABC transporter permease [Saccharibacillus alkalitolerans]
MVMHIARFYLLEQWRNKWTVIGNIMAPMIFLAFALVLRSTIEDKATADLIIKSQFLPFSLLILIFSLALSLNVLLLSEKKEDGTFLLLKRTDLKMNSYLIGTAAGIFIIFNFFLVFFLACYELMLGIGAGALISIALFANVTLLCLYPASYVLASFFKKSKKVVAFLTPITLLLMFSITMPSMLAMTQGQNPQMYYKFLFWNPMMIMNDIALFELNMIEGTWLPTYQYLLILIGLCAALWFAALKTFKIADRGERI